MILALPLWLVVATPCFYVVGFLVLARGWWLERRRAERLHELLDRYDVKAQDLAVASIPINEEVIFWRGEATYWQAEQAAAHAKVKALRGQLRAAWQSTCVHNGCPRCEGATAPSPNQAELAERAEVAQ